MNADEIEAMIVALDREESRRSFAAFARLAWPQVETSPCVWSWHMDAVCEHLEAVSRGQILDLVIAIPPGMSKSLLVSTLWPAWDWACVDATRRTIGATYAQALTEKNAALLRRLIASDWYVRRWPKAALAAAKDGGIAKIERFANVSRGWIMSTSVQGIATGHHADILRGDDLAKAQAADKILDPVEIQRANEFWFGTLHTRRANPATTKRVLVGQRLHHDDTPGRAIEAGYNALVLPMEFRARTACVVKGTGWKDPRTQEGELLCPARFSAEVVAQDRIALGPRGASAQMDQDPTPEGGMLFKDILALPRWQPKSDGSPPDGRTIITCDATFKASDSSDFVAIQVWRVVGRNYLLIDRETRRMGATETARSLIRMAARWPQAIAYVEDKANGPAIVDMLRGHLTGLRLWDPGGSSKTARAESREFLFAAGRVLMPPDHLAPWLPEYAKILQQFPLGKHDDDVDATTMALLILDSAAGNAYAAALLKLANEGGFR